MSTVFAGARADLGRTYGAWFGGRVRVLEWLAELVGPDTRVVPAHGPLITGRDIVRQRDIYEHSFETMCPLTMQRQLERVQGYIGKGKAEGARLVTGGGWPKGFDRGCFVEPTLFDDVQTGMTIQNAVDLYIAAQTSGDTSGLPLAQGLGYMENVAPADIDEGPINTIIGASSIRPRARRLPRSA